jgi:histidine triad (HIT) family protein
MNDCIFCKIAAGQIKANVVFDSPDVMAFRDVNPQAPVHILIIPKKHVPRISALTDGEAGLLLSIHRALLELVKTEPEAKTGFRFLTNEGDNAGQSVKHLHFHFLAGRHLAWPPG